MRRIVLAFSGTVLAVILLFGYRTSTGGSTAGASAVAPAAGTPGGTTTPATGTAPTPSTAAGSSATVSGSSTAAKTYNGSSADTRWGTVQVQITVQNGKITSATTLQVPDGNGRDQEINSYAVPILDQEVVKAQSAQIDTVSGATVTSDGYLQSLQAAIDAAGL
jgi:uncharacterized protein with FMN-binding domain